MMDAAGDLPAIRARDVGKTFRRESGETVHALAGVSFDVQFGALTALVGPDSVAPTRFICDLVIYV